MIISTIGIPKITNALIIKSRPDVLVPGNFVDILFFI